VDSRISSGGGTAVGLDKPRLVECLEAAIDAAWRSRPEQASRLFEAAERQVELGGAAYRRPHRIASRE
jgi:hypothetical protein